MEKKVNIKGLIDEAELLSVPNEEEVEELLEYITSDEEMLNSLINANNKLYLIGDIAEGYIESTNRDLRFSRVTKEEVLKVLEEYL